MSTVYLPQGSLVYLNGTIKLSEHNRAPMTLSTNRIEQVKRMANGFARKYFVADKKQISLSWNMLPSFSTYTIDGGYGALDLKAFYEGSAAQATGSLSGHATFDVSVKYGGVTEVFTMYFTQCSFDLVKRNVKQKSGDTAQEYWDVSITMDEV
jgi:hypothetical protein